MPPGQCIAMVGSGTDSNSDPDALGRLMRSRQNPAAGVSAQIAGRSKVVATSARTLRPTWMHLSSTTKLGW